MQNLQLEKAFKAAENKRLHNCKRVIVRVNAPLGFTASLTISKPSFDMY